jgi:hypothetical protein
MDPAPSGEPQGAVSQQTQLLVWRLSEENPLWGYQHIQGELLKVGIEISASSIRRVIAPKRRPGPKRDTWSKFMRTQAASIVACDLFTVETVRMKTLHVLFFIMSTAALRLRLVDSTFEPHGGLASSQHHGCAKAARVRARSVDAMYSGDHSRVRPGCLSQLHQGPERLLRGRRSFLITTTPVAI